MTRSTLPVWFVVAAAAGLGAAAGLYWTTDGAWLELAIAVVAPLTGFFFVRSDIASDDAPRARMHIVLRVSVAAVGIGIVIASLALRPLLETTTFTLLGFGMVIGGAYYLRKEQLRRAATVGPSEALDG